MNNDDDLIKAIYLFIKEFANPQLNDDCIIFAKQNIFVAIYVIIVDII